MPNNPFKGPDDRDPLTSKELMILQAIPQAAKTSPHTTAFRLPLGPDPAQGWIDVTFSETCSIVSRLARTWQSRLNNLLPTKTEPAGVGPGITICIFVQPSVRIIFHHLALGALGCTVQYMPLSLGDHQICSNLHESHCDVILHSGMDATWVDTMKDRWDGQLVALPEEEFSYHLASHEKEGRAGPVPPWPEPRRPTPALVLNSSGTTGIAKLIKFSLFWYTIPLPTDDARVISAAYFSGATHDSSKPPQTHPKLIFSPPFWQSYHSSLLIHLITATPVTFGYFEDAINLPSKQLIPWARALDAGSIICSPRFLLELSTEELEAQSEFLRSLTSISLTGGPVDHSMSILFEKHRLPITNSYASSEFAGGLSAKSPPYTHLLPGPKGPPLMLPISNPDSGGSRQVQLWHALSNSPQLAHFYARGGITMELEPFPGEGPHTGELAFNTHDIFNEVQHGEGVAYIFLGRSSDIIRLIGDEDINAFQFETELRLAVDTFWKEGSEQRWMVDAVQLFGNAMPHTALVIQLCPSSQRTGVLEREMLGKIYDAVNQVNKKLALGPVSVDTMKRVLVVTTEGEAYGPNSESVRGRRLQVTHKHSLQRWKNLQTFRAWLDGLEASKETSGEERNLH